MKIKKILILLLVFIGSLTMLSSCDFFQKVSCDHDYTIVSHEATCMNPGYDEYTCSKCGHSYTKTTSQALGHDFDETIIQAPTCTEDGIGGYVCKRCGLDTGTTAIPATGHDYKDTLKSGTCTEDGVVTHTCTKCGHHYDENVTAPGHKYEDHTSYDEDGNMIISHICSVCEYEDPNKIVIDFTSSALYGYNTDLSRYSNTEDLQKFYMAIIDICNEYKANTYDTPAEVIHFSTGDEYRYVIGNLNPSDYSLTTQEACLCWKLVTLDNPAYYWLSKEVIYSSDNTMFKITISEDYKEYSTRALINEGITNMLVGATASINDEMSDYQKAQALHDYLVTNIDYSYKADGKTPEDSTWAHNMVGAVLYQRGVCECYSKLYSYLCNTYGIECIFVSGIGYTLDGNGPHAWNYIKLDGNWYAVDATWDDRGGSSYDHDYFAVGSTTINKDHQLTISEQLSLDYLYQAPTLSVTDYN